MHTVAGAESLKESSPLTQGTNFVLIFNLNLHEPIKEK